MGWLGTLGQNTVTVPALHAMLLDIGGQVYSRQFARCTVLQCRLQRHPRWGLYVVNKTISSHAAETQCV